MNLPNYEFLSAPLWLITALHLLTFTLHLVAMNFLLGGVIVVLSSAARREWDDAALANFARLFPSIMAATVTLGVAPLLFLQLVFPRQVYAAAIVSGWWWLGVIAAAITAYYALYRGELLAEATGRVSIPALAVALLGLLYVSLVYSSVFSMAERPDLIHGLYSHNQSGWTWNPELGDYGMRWLHMVLGAVTVGGFFVALLGRDDAAVFSTGKRFFVSGMALAALTGLGYLLWSRTWPAAFIHTPAAFGLSLGVLLSLGSLHFFFKKRFWPSGAMLFVSMLTMAYARHTVRLLKLAPSFDPASWRVAPQWSPFSMFLACFLVMLVVLTWMFRMALRPRESAAQE